MSTDTAGPSTPVAGMHRSVPPGGTEVLASDAERERVTQRLRAAAVDGRLTLAESDERQAMAYAARTRDDLAPLVADLPRTPGQVRPRRGELTARARRNLVVHAAASVLVFLALWLVLVIGAGFFVFPFWLVFFLGLAVFVHFRRADREPYPEPMPANLR